MKLCEKQIKYDLLFTYTCGYIYSGFPLQAHGRIHLSHPFEVRVYDFIQPIEHKQKWYVSILDRSLKSQWMLNHPLLLYPRNNGPLCQLESQTKENKYMNNSFLTDWWCTYCLSKELPFKQLKGILTTK